MQRREILVGPVATAMAASMGRAGNTNAQTRASHRMPNYASTGVRLISDSTPAADGFYFPAEWERHEFTIMVMPPPQNWHGKGIAMSSIRRQWANVANQLNEFEPVRMIVAPSQARVAKTLLSSSIELAVLAVNDGWARDSGPMCLVNGEGDRRVAGFTFNGWGAKFPPYNDDALLKARLCKNLQMSMYPIDLVLEGGSIAVDGQGTLITTAQCLLNANRNPAIDQPQVEQLLNDSLGTEKVIWLQRGLTPDPITDGHVDGMLAFTEPGTVLLHTTDDRNDPNHKICVDAKRQLRSTVDAKGRKLEVIEVPLDGDLSHLNFYLGNGCVLVPITTDPAQDERPMGVLKDVFADYHVIGIDSRVLGAGGGGIHCITQPVPAV